MVRCIRRPCYFAEAVYLLYFFVNDISYEEDYHRVCQAYCRHIPEHQDPVAKQIRELTRVSQAVTRGMNREDALLQKYFAQLPGTDHRSDCCLAQVMLMAVPLDYDNIDAFADGLIRAYRLMEDQGIKINDMNPMGLILERLDEEQEQETLAEQLERLPCAIEGRWAILRVLTDYEKAVRELTEVIRPVAMALEGQMGTLMTMDESFLPQWEDYFRDHTVDDFQHEMFNTTFLFTEENRPHDIWLGKWYFNPFGTWSEWLEDRGGAVRTAYLGLGISFELSVHAKEKPDADALGGMLRALGGKDKLEILRRCAQQPCTPARLAAEMNLNSGTVSRNLYGLYKLGFLETKGDGERVNYVTKPETLEQLFRWLKEYVLGEGQQGKT